MAAKQSLRLIGSQSAIFQNAAVTVSGLQVLSTTWKSTDGTRSHWKYVVDNFIVYRDVYRGTFQPNRARPNVSANSGLDHVFPAMQLPQLLWLRRKDIRAFAQVNLLVKLIHVPSVPRRHNNDKDFNSQD
jgi:hypothetical protein